MESQIENIIAALNEKSVLKQGIYKNTVEVFARLKNITKTVSAKIAVEMAKNNPPVPVAFEENEEFEFSARYSGDLLIFTMHTNVVTLAEDHFMFGNPYLIEDSNRAFFGQILVYNFTADSVKYRRVNDEGYLISRILVNEENHFLVENLGQIPKAFADISKNLVSDDLLLSFLELNIVGAIHSDLQAAPFHELQVITLAEKEANRLPGAAEKVGFQMKSQVFNSGNSLK